MRVPLAIFLLVLSSIVTLLRAAHAHRTSCRDHLLNGHFTSGVFPFHLRGRVFNASCEFPVGPSKYSPHALFTTVVHSGLEKWLTLTGGSKHTVQFQVNDWQFLKSLVSQPHGCSQELLIQWPQAPNGESEERVGPELRIESLSGMECTFTPNYTAGVSKVPLNDGYAGVLHLHYSGDGTTHVKALPLRCQQPVISKPNCLFTLSSAADFLEVRVAEWMASNGGSGKGLATMAFAFRTDQPEGSFLRLGTGGSAAIEVSLIDGYLIRVNHLTHPVKLLADGNWHTAYLDLSSLTLHFDGPNSTAISLGSKQDGGGQAGGKIDVVNVLLGSEITAIKLTGGGNEEEWMCGQSSFLRLHQRALSSKSVCSLPPLVGNGAGTRSYCNCKGPKSALQVGSQAAYCPLAPKASEAYRLGRHSDKIAFFYMPDYTPLSSLSISFKSDASTGLVAFGSWSSLSEDRRHLRDVSSGEHGEPLSAVRVQIHFIGEVMYAAKCSVFAHNDERCHSCSIRRPNGFATGEWIRVSLFYFQDHPTPEHPGHYHQYMSVGEKVCELTPSGLLSDGTELYNLLPVRPTRGVGGPETRGALLVGGTFYNKDKQLKPQLADWFRMENTLEKPPSLRGCIGEVYMRGIPLVLDRVLADQVELLTQKNDSSVFSMAKGCVECSPLCQSAPCLVSSTLESARDSATCDCSAIHSKSLATGIGCAREEGPIEADIFPHIPRAHPTSLSLSTNETVALNIRDSQSRMRTSARLRRVWLLLRFPRQSKRFLKLGSFQLSVARKPGGATKLIMDVNCGRRPNREEFVVESADSDDRLHLIAIEQTPSVGKSMGAKSASIRVDGQLRTISDPGCWDAVPVGVGDDFVIYPASDGETESDIDAGCLAELVVSYGELHQEDVASEHGRDGHQNQDEQIDLLSLISHKLGDAEPRLAQRLVVNDRICGTRDPTLWSSPPSSPHGSVGAHDPEGVGQWRQGSSGGWASLLLCIFFILLLLIILCCYCAARMRRRRAESSFFRRQGRDGKLLKESMTSANEKKPLRVEAATSRTATTTTSSTTSARTPSSIAAASASPLIRSPTPLIRTPIRPPSSPSSYVSSTTPSTARENGHVQSQPQPQFGRGSPLDSSTPVYRAEYVLVRDDRKSHEQPELVIEEFNTSPKYWRGHKPSRTSVPPPEDSKDAPTEMRRSRVSVAAMPPTVPSPQQQAPIALQEE